MTTSSTVSAPSTRDPSEPLLARSAAEKRLDAQRRRSVPKITGRKLRTPRKFVVTDVPDDELDVLTPSAALDAASDASEQPRDEDNNNDNDNNNNSEDLSASSSSVRKGKTQVKGRFTITDLSPESPEREDLSSSMGPRALEAPRRQPSRRMATRKPFQSAGDARSSVGLTKSRLFQQQQQLQQQQQQQQYQQQQESPVFASFQRPAACSPSSGSMRAASPRPLSNQISHNTNQTQTVFDHHLEFLEKETHDMKTVLEKMVAANAQWIEALASAGLVQSNSAPRLSEASISEPVAPVEPPLEKKYREVERAYTELQAKYEAVSQKSERMEVKNAMLEIRLQQQINRSTMLRSQLDKLTQYTENMIGASSEPTLHDYNSDLNSMFGEHSEAHSPTADEMTSGGEYGFNYDVVKPRRQRWRGVDEECMSDTSTEGESMRKTSSPPPFEQDDDNNRYFSDMELTTGDLALNNDRDSSSAIDSLLDAECNQLRQSLRSKNRADADDPISTIESLDSLAVCPSVTNFGSNGEDEYDGNNQIGHAGPMSHGLKADLLKHSNSVASLNYSTVSSSSSLAGYGLHLATMAQSKSGYYVSVAAASLFGPHPEPYPNASNQQEPPQDDGPVYNVLSPENLRFHDCQSLLQAADERNVQKSTTRRGFPFTTSSKAISMPGANEVPERTQSTGSLLQRFAVRRR
ncbi:hypothetical protein PHYPSEUDO_010029 [Phytophthora pseudosyringae]|uniref:Uncharacterized protein n=1 Tax=Phytophthora pseudosyringae TaxID=221518 RepID=A0A8T1W6P0_9STRA|nr:hypothetical protein PHYPSEUDO_010029 [Phytophthora pseudosyringae]